MENQAGLINSSQSGVESHWPGVGAQGWTLDPVGSQQSVADRGQAGITEHENNAVNEYTVRRVKSSLAKPVFAQDTFGSNSSANWQKPGSGDAFNVNGTVPGRLVVTEVSQDSFESTPEAEARALLVTGEAIERCC